MDPGGVADELFEEHGCVGGSAPAVFAGVHDVGDLAFDLVAVVVGAGEAPEFFAGGDECGEEFFGGVLVVGEEAGVDLSERDDAGPGEGGGVDEVGAAEGFGVVEAVGEDEAAFGVGVDDLDGLAGHGGDDVAGLEGFAVGHVFGGADDADDFDIGLELRDGAHGSDHGGGSGHVVLHLFHALGGLDGDAAGVEGDALADEAEDGEAGLRAAGGLVGHDDEGGGFGGALCYGPEGSHAQLVEFGGGVDLAAEAGLSAHRPGALAEDGGGEDVAGLVDEGAGEVLGVGVDEAFFEAGLNFGARGLLRFVGEDGEELDGGVLAVAFVGVVVDLGELGAFDESAGHEEAGQLVEVFVGEGVVLGESDCELADVAWLECPDGGSGALADLIDGEGLDLAEAYDEQPLGLESGGSMEEEGFAQRRLEFAVAEDTWRRRGRWRPRSSSARSEAPHLCRWRYQPQILPAEASQMPRHPEKTDERSYRIS